MTKLTKNMVDFFCPEHDRSSCDDSDLCNSYGGWKGKYNPDTGKKEIVWPRCHRCYLLDNLGKTVEELEFQIGISLDYKL